MYFLMKHFTTLKESQEVCWLSSLMYHCKWMHSKITCMWWNLCRFRSLDVYILTEGASKWRETVCSSACKSSINWLADMGWYICGMQCPAAEIGEQSNIALARGISLNMSDALENNRERKYMRCQWKILILLAVYNSHLFPLLVVLYWEFSRRPAVTWLKALPVKSNRSLGPEAPSARYQWPFGLQTYKRR